MAFVICPYLSCNDLRSYYLLKVTERIPKWNKRKYTTHSHEIRKDASQRNTDLSLILHLLECIWIKENDFLKKRKMFLHVWDT